MPSLVSSVPNSSAKACLSSSAAVAASTARPAWSVRFASATAAGARLAILRAIWNACGSSPLGGQHFQRETDLPRLVGVDHLAGEDDLERARRAHAAREPLRAPEARDDAEVDLGLAEARLSLA